MDDKTRKICDDLVNYSQTLKKKMAWEANANAMAILSGFLCLSQGRKADAEKYVECKKLLKSQVSALSEFRGISQAIVVTKMMVANDPQEYLDGAMAVYKKLREVHKVWTSPYYVLTSLILYENGGVTKADENIERLESLYKRVQKEHPWLISDEDRPFLAILVASGLNEDAILEEMEACYQANKGLAAFNKNGVHSLAQLMCLSGKSVEEKTSIVSGYINGLKAAGKPVSKEYGLPAAGSMTLIDLPVDELISRTVEIDDYLKTQKGFKWSSTSPRLRRMYDQMVLMIATLNDNNAMQGTILSSTMAMVIIEQILMYIIVMETMLMISIATSSSSH